MTTTIDWKREEAEVETYTNAIGYKIYKATYADFWFIISPNYSTDELQFGPYGSREEAADWYVKIMLVVNKIHEERR